MARSAFVVFCVLMSASVLAAQSTVTNATLEKYRQKRLAAERDLRENYEKLGFPSPEELERQREESLIAREELANRLREERMQRERIEAELRMREMDAAGGTVVVINEETGERGLYYGYGYGGYGYGYGYPDWKYRGGRRYGGPGILWRAGPGGVIYEPGGRSANIWSPRINRQRPYFRQTGRPVIGPRPILRPR